MFKYTNSLEGFKAKYFLLNSLKLVTFSTPLAWFGLIKTVGQNILPPEY